MEGKEEWLPIKDFENYEISSLGQVHNTKTGRMLKLTTKGGYMFTGLSSNSKGKTLPIHRLVALAFIENPDTVSDLNLLSGYVWKYEGAEESMEFEEFFVGLLEDKFSPQNIIARVQKMVKWQIAKGNESV